MRTEAAREQRGPGAGELPPRARVKRRKQRDGVAEERGVRKVTIPLLYSASSASNVRSETSSADALRSGEKRNCSAGLCASSHCL